MIYFINFLCVQYGTTSFFKVLDKMSVPQEESYHLNFSISSEVFNLLLSLPLYLNTIIYNNKKTNISVSNLLLSKL